MRQELTVARDTSSISSSHDAQEQEEQKCACTHRRGATGRQPRAPNASGTNVDAPEMQWQLKQSCCKPWLSKEAESCAEPPLDSLKVYALQAGPPLRSYGGRQLIFSRSSVEFSDTIFYLRFCRHNPVRSLEKDARDERT